MGGVVDFIQELREYILDFFIREYLKVCVIDFFVNF